MSLSVRLKHPFHHVNEPVSGVFTRFKKSLIIYHMIGWTIFLVYDLWGAIVTQKALGFRLAPWFTYASAYSVNILLFYFHALVTLPSGFEQKKRKLWLFFLLTVAEVLAYLLLMVLAQGALTIGKGFFFYPNNVALYRQIYRCVFFLAFGSVYWIIQRNFNRLKKMKDMETQALIREQEKTDLELKLASTQNAFLQSQINPHLLFNTLNFVYGKVHEVSQPASDVIITLSDIMRYSLVENKQDARVKLSREIEQIENLIKINQYRFDNNLQLKLKIEGNWEEALIIPLLLVPFVENLFKYADLSDPSHTATVQVTVEDDVLEFSTFNKKKKTIHFQSTGIGIQNVKTRLDAYYADQYSLEVREHEPYFTVSLRIKL